VELEFGVIVDFRNPAGQDWAAHYDRQLAQIRRAEDLGFDVVALTEHHFVPDGYTPSLLPVAAAIARETRSIRIMTWVLLLPLHHPLHVAEGAAAVDILSSGRFELGVGLGYRLEEFAGFGVDHRARGAIMDESLAVLLGALEGSPVSHAGVHLSVDAPAIGPTPIQQPFPVWVGARTPRSARRAGRFRCPLLVVPGGAGTYEAWAEAAEGAGGTPGDLGVGVQVGGWVSDEPDATWAELRDALRASLDAYATWYGAAADVPDDPLAYRLAGDGELRAAMRIGSADDVCRAIDETLTRMPVRRVLCMPNVPGVPLDTTDRYLEAFATRVIPRYRDRPGT
jgi:alkanesulfonate monooxygenase SsuD/methylene tetrahydromethanopterin reductase-like flavin-dependent oxidoreductase (luciferase family)